MKLNWGLVDANDLTREDLNLVLELVGYYQDMSGTVEGRRLLRRALDGYEVDVDFYQPSVRTFKSFVRAASRLGASVIATQQAGVFSSTLGTKKASLADEIRVASGYSDLIVLRHPGSDSSDVAAEASCVPVISGGAGTRHHPTQAVGDFVTKYQFCDRDKPLAIAYVGDPRYSRTIRSDATLLASEAVDGLLSFTRMYFVAPKQLQIEDGFRRALEARGVDVVLRDRLTEDLLRDVDVVNMTRAQAEYHQSWLLRLQLLLADTSRYRLTLKLAQVMKPTAIIMHPLPRNDELPAELDDLPQAKYFAQTTIGLYTRMALLTMFLRGVTHEALQPVRALYAEYRDMSNLTRIAA